MEPHIGDDGDDFPNEGLIAMSVAETQHHTAGQKTATAMYGASWGQKIATEAAGTEFFTFIDDEPAAGERSGPVEDPWRNGG